MAAPRWLKLPLDCRFPELRSSAQGPSRKAKKEFLAGREGHLPLRELAEQSHKPGTAVTGLDTLRLEVQQYGEKKRFQVLCFCALSFVHLIMPWFIPGASGVPGKQRRPAYSILSLGRGGEKREKGQKCNAQIAKGRVDMDQFMSNCLSGPGIKRTLAEGTAALHPISSLSACSTKSMTIDCRC